MEADLAAAQDGCHTTTPDFHPIYKQWSPAKSTWPGPLIVCIYLSVGSRMLLAFVRLSPPCRDKNAGMVLRGIAASQQPVPSMYGIDCWPEDVYFLVCDTVAVLALAAAAARASTTTASGYMTYLTAPLCAAIRIGLALVSWAAIETALLHSPLFKATVPAALWPPVRTWMRRAFPM
eukprot:SAG31_NODE_2194_length_6224_cov_3.140408_6_plen_177_part_00